ncbi:MAG: hypothetical protein R3C68_17080 [Myxococcota bacterium]
MGGSRSMPFAHAISVPTNRSNFGVEKIAGWALLALINSVGWQNMVMVPGVGTVARTVGIVSFGVTLIMVLVTARVRAPQIDFLAAAAYLCWAMPSFSEYFAKRYHDYVLALTFSCW